jgi:hypothetical protein
MRKRDFMKRNKKLILLVWNFCENEQKKGDFEKSEVINRDFSTV